MKIPNQTWIISFTRIIILNRKSMYKESDFSKYLLMKNEEEFDKAVIQQLMEEESTGEMLKNAAMWEDKGQHD